MPSREIEELKLFWVKVVSALSRLVALAVFVLSHYELNRLLSLVFETDMALTFRLAKDMTSVIFIMIYVYLCWDMVLVFVPQLRPASYFEPVELPKQNPPKNGAVRLDTKSPSTTPMEDEGGADD